MNKNGFSLIELVVAMGIIGILAAIAIPAYSSYTRSANRTDATRTLTNDAQALERCYSQNFSYVVNCPAAAATPATSQQGYYTIAIAAAASSYTITATPRLAPQTKDTECWTFTLNNTGTQTAATEAGLPNTQPCWGST